MRHKTSTIYTRIEPEIKAKAEEILDELGLSSAEVIRLLYRQICVRKGVPFEIRIFNKKTLQAIKNANNRKTHQVESVGDLFQNLD